MTPKSRPKTSFENRPHPWLAGTAAALGTASFVNQAGAETVQITLGETRTFSNTAQLDSNDLTGDGIDDRAFSVQHISYDIPASTLRRYRGLRITTEGGTFAAASVVLKNVNVATTTKYFAYAGFNLPGGRYGVASTQTTPTALNEFFPFTFSDRRINGGAVTNGRIELNIYNSAFEDHTIAIVRLVFDDAGTAAPTGLDVGVDYPEWIDPTPAKRAALLSQIQKLKKKIRIARKKHQTTKVQRLKKKLRRLKIQLAAL